MYTVYRMALLCLIASLAVFVTGCGEKVFDGEGEILSVMQQAENGWNAGDLEAYMSCYHRSENLRFAGDDRLSFGWHQVLENYRKAYPDQKSMGRLDFYDLDISPLGKDSALVVGRWRLDRDFDQPHGVFTLVMRRMAAGWRIVHDHTSSGDGTLNAAEASITEADLVSRVELLSSPAMTGRLPGTEGYRLAAEFAANHFAALGLEPGGDDGYFQCLPIESNEVIGQPVFRLTGAQNNYTLGEDFLLRGFTGQGRVSAPVVFCGYGLSAPEKGYDDYAGVDVSGKIVLVFKQGPNWPQTDGENWGSANHPRPKANTAAAHGALAVLLVSKPADTNPQPLIGSVMHGEGQHPENIPQLQISLEVAEDLLDQDGWDLLELQGLIDESQAPYSVELSVGVDLEVETIYQQEAETWNVVGILPGSDPELRNEYLVLGAHLDHVGLQGGQALFPGANDNASGSAAIMEIAEAFTRAGSLPRRTVIFVLFSGEEQGLIGSKYYAEQPVRPLETTVAMFNFDCVAHGDGIKVGGGKSAPLLWGRALQLDAMDQKLMVTDTWGHGGADATPFSQKGLPTLYFVTKNSYDHLHRTSDTVDTLNGPLFEAITRLGYRMAAWVADGSYQRETLPD
jgi:ketosteroid isomerase-like protein